MVAITKFASKTDEKLVKLTLQDQEVFAYLINRYEAKLLRYIIRISGVSREEAEDILQETFIKAYRNLNSFNPSLKFSSWIYRITRNQAISAYRKNKIREAGHVLDIDDDILNNIASNLDTGQAVDLDYLRQNIDGILNRVDKKYREVLVLKFLEEKSYQEISDILKKPMGTVATLINRAKKDFRKEMAKQKIKL